MRNQSASVDTLRLRVSLEEIEPPIWRTVLVKSSITLHELHRTIQLLFQWYHYTYDFGDDWRHLIEVTALEKSNDPDWLPVVLDGARRGPPEDCGGPHRYSEIQKFALLPLDDLEEEDRSTVPWLGDAFDPEEFSLAQARHDLLLVSAWGGLKRKR